MKLSEALQPGDPKRWVWFVRLLLVLLAILCFTFSSSFKPEQALFSNDGPLGAQISKIYDMPGAFRSVWSDLYWLGSYGGYYPYNFTGVLLWLAGPIWFNKLYVPLSLVILGLCAAFYFRQLRFHPTVCLLGGLAAALNSNFFSNACWGLSSRALSLAAAFLALAAVQSSFAPQSILKVLTKTILAGLAIGLSITEGGDNGAIFSLVIAAYAAWMSWCQESPLPKRILIGGIKVAAMAGFAALLAAQTLNVFVGTAVKGIVGVEQDSMTKEAKWNWATQWSLPKMESLRVVVPGLFGYRLDTPKGGEYWGGVGQDPAYETTKQGFPRHSGAGEYAGIMVVLVAIWALAHSFAVGGSFTANERRMIWFWGIITLVTLLLSWGRHAPFYQFVYALPYFSTIRNPMKFMHPCHLALMVLFAYGLQGLWRRYVEATPNPTPKTQSAFDKKWLVGSGFAIAAAVLGWLVYSSARSGLTNHLTGIGFEEQTASQIARFSSQEVGWSIFFLVVSSGIVLLIMKGAFKGNRARWLGWAVGIVLVVDLSRANSPWIKYYDYKEKYANNGIFETLANKAWEHRVTIPPLQGDRNFSIFQQIYSVEWLQHQFPFYNIQSLDQPQEPRMPADKAAYRGALGSNLTRLWELTNTRFLCGMAGGFVDAVNQQLDPVQRRFKLHTRFNFFQNPGSGAIGARVDENGPFALVEFTGALPRAKLFNKWEVNTNTPATLARLADPAFDPHQTALVMDPIPSPAVSTNVIPGTVAIAAYEPKRIEMTVTAPADSLLVLNDKYDAGWIVTIDGKPATMLRANFLVRGVQVPAGNHTVVFRFQPHSSIYYVSLIVTVLGVLLCAFVAFESWKRQNSTVSKSATS